MNDRIDWTRLARYLAREASTDERIAVERWLAADPTHSQLLREVEAWWRAAEPRVDTSAARALARLHARLEATQTGEVRAPERSTARRQLIRRGRPPRFLAAAAIVGVLLVGAVLVRVLGGGPHEQVYATRAGERSTVTLADGSTVHLNVASTLHVAVSGSGARVVQLEGQALFDVTHDASRPFQVRVQGATVEVRGTRFDVRAYPGDERHSVAVESGLVAVRGTAAGQELLVAAGQIADIAAGMPTLRERATAADMPVWRERRIQLQNVTLREAARTLERWYDVEIEVAHDSLGNRRVTALLDAARLTDVLDALALVLDVEYSIEGRTVRFDP